MSIEQTLERIAVALETIAGLKKEAAPSIEPVKTPKAVDKPAKGVKATDVATEEDIFNNGGIPPETGTATHTQDSILAELKGLAKSVSADVAKKLMIKYGAKAAAPKVAEIKAENYPALSAEIKKLTPKG